MAFLSPASIGTGPPDRLERFLLSSNFVGRVATYPPGGGRRLCRTGRVNHRMTPVQDQGGFPRADEGEPGQDVRASHA